VSAHDHSDLHTRFDGIEAAIERLKHLEQRLFLAGEWEHFTFNGKTGQTRVLDDHGSNCLALAVYNPNKIPVFVGWAGRSPEEGSGLKVPKQTLLVAPIQINGSAEFGVNSEELAEGTASIFRVRFPTPQPFFAGPLP
jgi:hypothetical protein